METKSTEKRQVRRITWEELDFTEQRVYIRQAEYLVEKGYVKGDPFEIAKSLFYKRNR